MCGRAYIVGIFSTQVMLYLIFIPLDDAIPSGVVIVIVSWSDEWAGSKNGFWSQPYPAKSGEDLSVIGGLIETHDQAIECAYP